MKRALISAAVTAAAVTLSSSPAWAAPATPDSASAVVLPGQAAYTVVPGDTFWAISQRYGVTMQDLADWNHLDLWAPLDAGWTLEIPPAGWHSGYQASSHEPATSEQQGSGYQSYSPASSSSGYPSASASGTSGYGSSSGYSPSGVWSCIAAHESGSNPAADTGNGYYGMYQFTLGTWHAAGGVGNPADASAAEQTAVAQRVQEQQGWGAWPTSSRECGA